MNYQWMNSGKLEQGGGHYVITLKSSTSFNIDSNYGSSNKSDYVLSFTTGIIDVSLAMASIPAGNKIVTWIRKS
jgi:hypothetical protein